MLRNLLFAQRIKYAEASAVGKVDGDDEDDDGGKREKWDKSHRKRRGGVGMINGTWL